MMNAPRLRSPAAVGVVHPAVLDRRIRELLLLGLTALIPAAIAVGLVIGLPHVSLLVVLAVIAAAVGVVALMLSPNLGLTVTVLVLYLGLLDGPVKLFFPSRELTASVQDILIIAICLGAVMRLVVRKEVVHRPALSGWVIAFVALVLINAFNPQTNGILHILGGFRNQLQYVPFFFFGYVLIRSRQSFRRMFIIMGVIALANGVVGAYQTELSPSQLASWGPGYRNLIHPEAGTGTGRTYVSEGEARVRPPGLGSEAGFSGGVGKIALPLCLALLAVTRKRRWFAALLCLGAMIAVIVGLGREQLIGSGLGVFAFAGLAFLSGRRVTRALGALLAIVILAIPTGVLVVGALRSGTFKRYESIGASTSTTLHKESAWAKIPGYLAKEPLGFGLGTSGAVAGFGGTNTNPLAAGFGVTSETEYNVLVKELGAPGLLLWSALAIYVIVLTARGIRRFGQSDMSIYLAGTLAPFVVLPIEGTTGGLTGSTASGSYFWFAIGVAAYWFAGPGRARMDSPSRSGNAQLAAV